MRRVVVWIDAKVESLITRVYDSVIRDDESPPSVWVKLAVVAIVVGLVAVALAVDLHID
jgi:hypothetical protein